MKLSHRALCSSFALLTVLGTLNFACGGGSNKTLVKSKQTRDALDPNFYTTPDARPSTYIVTLTDSASAAPASSPSPGPSPTPSGSPGSSGTSSPSPTSSGSAGIPVAADAPPGEPTNFVAPDPATVSAAATALCNQYGGQASEVWGESGSFLATGLTETQARAMSNDVKVAQVSGDSPSLSASATQILNANGLDQWNLDRIDQRPSSHSNSFTYTSTGLGVNVYVADSGIRLNHPEFGGRADDVFIGWNGNQDDVFGHGTVCASLVGGTTTGVAKDVRLHSVKILGDHGQGYWSDAIRGFNWINTHAIKPAVLTCSVSSNGESHGAAGAERAISSLANSGVICVVAAGNANINANAASFAKVSEMIVVGASDRYDSFAVFGGGAASNYGPRITLFAPGLDDYVAAFPGALHDDGYNIPGYYANASGTSVATPMVAGIAAQYLQTHPTATNAQVKAWLISNATVGALYGLPANTPNRLVYTNQ